MEKDAPGALAAIFNQIPASMEVTRNLLIGIGSAAAGQAQEQKGPQPGGVNPIVVLGFLLQAVVGLENRMERVEGRAGFDDAALRRLLSEFGLKS